MACGCRKNKGTDARPANGASGNYQVWRNGSYTGRAFVSIGSAQTYANRIGGEVRATSPQENS
jgi:hypothetical protein